MMSSLVKEIHMDNVIKNKYSGLTELETAIRNLKSEIAYYTARGDHAMAARLQEQVTIWEQQL